jgi:hypothetical protein
LRRRKCAASMICLTIRADRRGKRLCRTQIFVDVKALHAARWRSRKRRSSSMEVLIDGRACIAAA